MSDKTGFVAPETAALLRKEVQGAYQVLKCEINVEIKPDFSYAKYVYNYSLKKTGNGENAWRETFAYPKEEVREISAHTGNDSGLAWDLLEIRTPGLFACLIVKFDRELQLGENYHFKFSCVTKIDGSKIHKFMGTSGAISYWHADEYSVENLRVSIDFPKGTKVMDAFPQRGIELKSPVVFEKISLAPMQFFNSMLLYEKRFFAIPVKYSSFVEAAIVGAFFLILGKLWR